MADLPSVDDFFGPSAGGGGQVPTVDEFFAPPQKSGLAITFDALKEISGRAVSGMVPDRSAPVSSPAMDEFFTKTPVGRVMDAFGQGVKAGWGAQPLGITPEQEAEARKMGWFNDYQNNRTSLLKSFNEAIIRPAAWGLDAILRTGAASIQAVGGAIQQTGTEAGQPLLGRDVAGMVEEMAMRGSGPRAMAGVPGVPIVPLARARSLGVIGEGEGGFAGTKAVTPLTEAERAAAVKESVQAAEEQAPAAGAPPEGAQTVAREPVPEQAPAAPDIHAVAREVAPDTFREYDALTQRRETFRRWLDELRETRDADPRIAAVQTEIDSILEKVNGVEDRLTKRAEARLDALRDQIYEFRRTDTPDMSRVRADLQKVDYRMRDLAPDVARAYREAGEREPAALPPAAQIERSVNEIAPERPAEPATPAPAEIEEAARQPESPLKEQPEKLGGVTTREHLDNIANEVAKRLRAAGRPAEESDASGQLIAAHYEARAARFGGEKGNAYELFAQESPRIEAGKSRSPAMAQTKRGSITVRQARNTIRLFKDADASTFIHETGHDWLEEMMRDAADPAAVESIKADAQAVRDWLGVKDGEAIPRKAHEKFARGFERYMMEGVAPSQKLAQVFAKFKQWLTAIYQTVSKLRSPINDDIRGVFDRLLATSPEEPVIAPEREQARQMADLHEVEAETVAPDKAAEAAPQIRADIDRAVKEGAPDAYDGIPHKETGREPRTDAVPDGGSHAPEPAAGAEGSPAERGEVIEGGNEAVEEGPGPRPEPAERPAPGEPNSANEPFTERETNLVDKAGNIRLDNLSTPEDVTAVIRQTSADHGDFVTERRGVMPDAEVIDLADALGMDAASLDRRKIGEAFNAEQIVAARKLLIKSATELRDAMGKAASGSDADVLAYAAARDRHIMIQRQVAGITAEAGRALRAFRKLEGQENVELLQALIQDETGRTLDQLKREAALGAQLDDPRKVSKFLNDSTKPTFLDMIQEFWINALLSGPRTHVKNIVGNALVALNSVAETAGASVVGKVLGSAERIELNEAKARFFGITQGAKDGLRAAKAIIDSEEAIAGSHTVEKPRQKAIPGTVGKIVRAPTRALAVEDEVFKAIGYRQELNALAYREANKLGLTGLEFEAHVARLITDPPEAMMEQARKSAEYQTFTNALGPTGRAIQNFANSHFLAKFLLPFIRTPVNILKFAGERTILGLASPAVRGRVMGAEGTVARDTQIARMGIGTSLAVAAAALALEGTITGGGPSDKNQRALLRLTGWQPYSVRIGDMYYSYQWADPFSTIMGVASDMSDIAKFDIAKGETGEAILSDAMTSIVKSAASKTSLRGISDFLQMASDPDRYAEQYLSGFAAGFVPNILGQTASMLDPQVRQTRSALDEVRSKIPFLSQDLPVRRDIWGNPLEREGAAGPDIISPVYQSSLTSDPVNRALMDSGYYPGYPAKKIRGVELTDQQYDDYARISGRMAKMMLDQIVALPGFGDFPALQRLGLMRNAVEHSRESARAVVMMQNPDLIQKAIDAKLQAELGKK